MKKFAVIGLGRFGTSVAKTLTAKGQQVIAVDIKESLVQGVMDRVTKAACLDATDETAVRSMAIHDVDVAVNGIGTDIEASILVTLLLKELGVLQVICKADSEAHKKVLEKVGADKVLLPEKDTGRRTAETLISISDKVLDQMGLYGNASILEILTPEEFWGKTLRELKIRKEFGVNILAIKKEAKLNGDGEKIQSEGVNVTPQADDVIAKGDVLVVFGENDRSEKLKKT